MEFSLLYAIPRSEFLDSFFLVLTKIAGSYGQLWIYIGILLLLFKKTRRTGAACSSPMQPSMFLANCF